MENETKQYDIFRKKFHIPSIWINNETFKNLVEHKYMAEEAKNTFVYLEKSLKELGYIDDNEKIVHDYLHYMIMDLLQSEDIAFITENEINESNELLKLFEGLTPDLIIKSDESKGRMKPMILDVYIGKNEEKVMKKKAKYRQMGISFDVEGITLANYSSVLKKLVPQQKVNYLYNQVQIFLTEHQYWRACLKLKKILFNDIANIEIISFDFPEKFEMNKLDFKSALINRASVLLDNDGL